MTGEEEGEKWDEANETPPPVPTIPFNTAAAEFKLKREFLEKLMKTFIRANFAVFFALAVAFIADLVSLRNGIIQPADRLVSEQVLMALIGATVVQVGAAIITITSNLFPKSDK